MKIRCFKDVVAPLSLWWHASIPPPCNEAKDEHKISNFTLVVRTLVLVWRSVIPSITWTWTSLLIWTAWEKVGNTSGTSNLCPFLDTQPKSCTTWTRVTARYTIHLSLKFWLISRITTNAKSRWHCHLTVFSTSTFCGFLVKTKLRPNLNSTTTSTSPAFGKASSSDREISLKSRKHRKSSLVN